MARPKKIVPPIEEIIPVVHIPIAKLSVDYPSEGLNNMAKKINELIDLYESRISGE